MYSLNYLIGMKEDVALRVLADADIRFRVTRRDNIIAVVTRDHDSDRVNLQVDNDKVTKATYG